MPGIYKIHKQGLVCKSDIIERIPLGLLLLFQTFVENALIFRAILGITKFRVIAILKTIILQKTGL